MPGLKDFFKSGAEGLVKGVTDGAANIISKLKADPTKVMEAEKELEKLRLDAAQKSEELAVKADEMYLKDTQDARNANAQIQNSDKASWLAKNVGYIIDLFLTALWGTVTIILFLKIFKIAAQDVDMVSLMALHGTVTAVFMTVVNFHRGTSKGSEDKQKHLMGMIGK